MTTTARRLAGALTVLASLPATAAVADLRPFEARYHGKATIVLVKVTAEVDLVLQRLPGFMVYTMRSRIKAPLIERRFVDCSVMRVEGEKLTPLEYLHLDLAEPRRDVRTRFDWTQGTATTMLGDSTTTVVATTYPTWDPMSFQVALMALAPQRRGGDRETHRVVERGALKRHEVTFRGEVAAEGRSPPLSVSEIVSEKERGRITLQLLPALNWQPLKVAIDEVVVERDPERQGPPPPELAAGRVPTCEVPPRS